MKNTDSGTSLRFQGVSRETSRIQVSAFTPQAHVASPEAFESDVGYYGNPRKRQVLGPVIKEE